MLLLLIVKHLEETFLSKSATEQAFWFRPSKFVDHIQQLLQWNGHTAFPMADKNRGEGKRRRDVTVLVLLDITACRGALTRNFHISSWSQDLSCVIPTRCKDEYGTWEAAILWSRCPFSKRLRYVFYFDPCSNLVAIRKPYTLAPLSQWMESFTAISFWGFRSCPKTRWRKGLENICARKTSIF